MKFHNVCFICLSFDTSHCPTIQYSTTGGLGVNMIHLSASNMMSAWNQPLKNQKFQENIIANLSIIKHAITSKLRPLWSINLNLSETWLFSLYHSFLCLINVVVPYLRILFWTPASAADAAAVNHIGIKTL